MSKASVRPSGTVVAENSFVSTQSCLREYRQAEHKKFYYKGEHVILTTKAGCFGLLENAVEYLQKNLNDLPVIQTYNSVGDSKRPQHKTVVFDEDKIIVTGKKSSGLVGQVYDILNAHFHSLDDRQKIRTKANSTLQGTSIIPSSLGNKFTNSAGDSVHTEFKVTAPNGLSQKVDVIPEDSKSGAPLLGKEQKRPTKTSLFSRAITAIHSQTHARAQHSRASLTESCEEVRSDKSSATESNSQCDSSSPDVIILDDLKAPSKISRICNEVNQPGLAARPESIDVHSVCHATSSSVTHKNASSLPNFMQQLPPSVCQFVSQVEQSHVPNDSLHSAEGSKEVCCKAVANLFSGAVIPAGHNPNRVTKDVHSVGPYSKVDAPIEEESTDLDNVEPEHQNPKNFVQVYGRELLLELSQCASAANLPVELIVDTECEILLIEQSKEDLFDVAQHRLPRIELAMFNPYNNVLYNSSAIRRPGIETQERPFASTSDPRSWGDSSIHKRTRNLHSAPAADVLYSESAYNCMDAVPDHASYCPELDEVFKNNAKVVPGVAFTRRPKESQDSQYVQELLSYYEPQNN